MVSAETVNCFKTRLDGFWLNQDIIYNFRSEIHGTGSRSEITVKFSLYLVIISLDLKKDQVVRKRFILLDVSLITTYLSTPR